MADCATSLQSPQYCSSSGYASAYSSNENVVADASKFDVRRFVDVEEARMMRHLDGLAAKVSEVIEPRRHMPMLVEAEVRHLLAVGVDGREDTREDLKRQTELHFEVEPETPRAEIRRREGTKVLR